MNIEKLVRDPILVLATLGTAFFFVGKLFNIPILTVIAIHIYYFIGIIGLILWILVIILVIIEKFPRKK